MATLLQGYLGVSDAEAVELSVVDLRWQMVLGVVGATMPAFSQGALHEFRHRMIAHEMDRRLLARTAEVACQTRDFDARKLPQTLRVAVDSAPLEEAGRVEDTINLLAHAARKIIECVAAVLGSEVDEVCEASGIPLLSFPSVKRGLDRDWCQRRCRKGNAKRRWAISSSRSPLSANGSTPRFPARRPRLRCGSVSTRCIR